MSMTFDMSATTGARESGNRLNGGIHKAKFLGIALDKVTSQSKGDFNVMALKLDIDGYGEYTQNFFEPSSSERTQSQYGENPSQVEHFLIIVRQILDALDPSIGEKIDNKEISLSGDFKKIVKTLEKSTAKYAGTEVEVKMIPGSNGFCSMPGFPAKITRAGSLGIATKIIGHDLVLTSSETKKVNEASKAKPTNMDPREAEKNSLLNAIKDDLGLNDSDSTGSTDDELGGDLPF